ncbi:translation initiation factor [Lewinella cohaerens]|uniref:translation initiation factor n=1 Tax=Lewinella cohaerens TaxID=70995 RepID=UPI0003663B19|nr:translation initiation factor [Lewinella cohaerens]
MARDNEWKNLGGLVFSTNPDVNLNQQEEEEETLDAADQKLRIWLDRKKRKGKAVTLITGFEGNDDDLKSLAKSLKTYCGVGGSAKDGEILVQGDQRDKVLKFLLDKGYGQTKKSGG